MLCGFDVIRVARYLVRAYGEHRIAFLSAQQLTRDRRNAYGDAQMHGSEHQVPAWSFFLLAANISQMARPKGNPNDSQLLAIHRISIGKAAFHVDHEHRNT